MKEVCTVFTYQRDELLYLCLEAIRNQDAKIPIAVFPDRGHGSEDLFNTVRKFAASSISHSHTISYGNSYNLIEGLRWAVGSGAEIVHAIEDDTIIHKNYLDWARVRLSSSRAGIPSFAVALGRIPGDTLSTWYESPCASWNASCLSMCLEKVPIGYFANTREEMQTIVDAAFPHSRYKFGSAEQDGFFLRCLEFFKWKTAYPDHSFASHIGTYGYNREGGVKPDGTFDERIAFFRKLLYDRARRTELFGQRITDSEMEGLLR